MGELHMYAIKCNVIYQCLILFTILWVDSFSLPVNQCSGGVWCMSVDTDKTTSHERMTPEMESSFEASISSKWSDYTVVFRRKYGHSCQNGVKPTTIIYAIVQSSKFIVCGNGKVNQTNLESLIIYLLTFSCSHRLLIVKSFVVLVLNTGKFWYHNILPCKLALIFCNTLMD